MEDQLLRQAVDRYAPSVYRLAYARTGNHADAEDIMQEVFLRLVRKNPIFHEEEHCRAWLLRVTINCTNSLFRSPWRKRTEPLGDALPAAEQNRAWNNVLDAVLALPGAYRSAIHLFYYEQYTVKEIGAILGKSEQAVKNILHRARGMLREELKGAEYDV